jgi:hypothetical protein
MLVEAFWTKPYLAYLVRGELLEDPIHHRQVMRCSKAFTIINGELYKRSTTGVLQRCIAQEDGITLLREIHEGTCGHHASSRTLIAKAFRSGFYWLWALYDARNIVQQCEACQLFATKLHTPASEPHTIPVAWPFAQWGLDQVGPLPKSSRGNHTYLLVAVDKFSKWIEAVPVTNQEATTAVKFFESIVYRYGVPNIIITDNDTNFTSGEFQEFAKKLGIKIKYASVAHPKSNGQVEKANRLVCAGLKKRHLRPLKPGRRLGRRTTAGPVEPADNPKLFDGLHVILPVFRGRGGTTNGRALLRASRGGLCQRRRRKGIGRCPRPAG